MRNYDPGRIVVTFDGARISGFMSGTFVSAEREVEAFTKDTGSDGEVTRVRSRNKSGSITLTLKAESPSNDFLSSKARLDELFGTGVGAFMVKDLNGATVLEAPEAWVQKLPTVEYSDEASGREWIIDCAELIEHVGGATV